MCLDCFKFCTCRFILDSLFGCILGCTAAVACCVETALAHIWAKVEPGLRSGRPVTIQVVALTEMRSTLDRLTTG